MFKYSQVQFIIGRKVDIIATNIKPTNAMNSMKKHAKYIIYLHLYFPQQDIKIMPNKAIADSPIKTA